MTSHEQKIYFSTRGTVISLYTSSPIIEASEMLTAILKRWNNDNSEIWLDIDLVSFNFLVTFYNHLYESRAFPSIINDKLTKLYFKKLLDNPDYISTAKYLGIDLELEKWFICHNWECNHNSVTILNSCVKNELWHYVDCIVYIAFMLQEKMDKFKNLIIQINHGIDDSRKTKLSCISLNILNNQIIDNNYITEKNELIFGYNDRGSYANQINTIFYKSLEDIIENMIKTDSIFIKDFYLQIINLIPGYNNLSLRKLL